MLDVSILDSKIDDVETHVFLAPFSLFVPRRFVIVKLLLGPRKNAVGAFLRQYVKDFIHSFEGKKTTTIRNNSR